MSVNTTNSDKPQVTVDAHRFTDTITKTNQQNVKDKDSTDVNRAVNAFGIQIMKGGNVLGDSFINSVLTGYYNLVYQPWALALLLVSTLFFLSQITGNTAANPFSLMVQNMLRVNNESSSTFLKTITAAAAGVFSFFDSYGYWVALASGMAFPYMAKPSKRNASFGSILFTFAVLTHLPVISCLALSHAFFLMVELRDPAHKFLVIAITIITIIIGNSMMNDLVGLDEIRKTYTKPVDPPPPGTRYSPQSTSTSTQRTSNKIG